MILCFNSCHIADTAQDKTCLPAAVRPTWQQLMMHRRFILKNGSSYIYLLTAAGRSSSLGARRLFFPAAAEEPSRYSRED